MKKKNDILLELRNLSFSYPEQTEKILDNVSFSLKRGDFAVLCGPSGCGKSTLLKHLRTAVTPSGARKGEILFDGRKLETLDKREQTERIGFVLQSPEDQIVTDKVWHELAFGMESLGYETPVIRRRVAEMAAFFGITEWFYQPVEKLSGGQKQLLNLAAVMTLTPDLLILDEPSGQLDPIAASDFFSVLKRLNSELGTTVLVTEQRLDGLLPMASGVLVMDQGRIICDLPAREAGLSLYSRKHPMFLSMPVPMRIWAGCNDRNTVCPLTVGEGRIWIGEYAETHRIGTAGRAEADPCRCAVSDGKAPESGDSGTSGKELLSGHTASFCGTDASEPAVITVRDAWFRYEKNAGDIVKGLNLTIRRGEIAVMMGGNGTGKTTSLRMISGALKPYRGTIETSGRLALLPQNPETLFVRKTVREDLLEMEKDGTLLAQTAALCRLEGLMDRHPYDLSGGEKQRLALAKILLAKPDILLMDEPTKGLDAEFKRIFAEILHRLTAEGKTVLMASHDTEFAAEYAGRCLLFFDGNIVSEGGAGEFFSGNSFYTTAAARMAGRVIPGAVTAADVIRACTGNAGYAYYGNNMEPDRTESMEKPNLPDAESPEKPNLSDAESPERQELPDAEFPERQDLPDAESPERQDLPDAESPERPDLSNTEDPDQTARMAENSDGNDPETGSSDEPAAPHPRRRKTAAVICFLLIPLTVYFGNRLAGDRGYYAVILAVLVECLAAFFAAFEGKKPKARELVLIAALSAVGAIGRTVFGMLPNFNPVVALVVITGASLGSEAGFTVGAMTMLVSNFVFSQGPWTPWQMFAMGIIGFIAGVVFNRGILKRTRAAFCIFGALCAIIIYGGIMNPASVLMWQGYATAEMVISSYLMGLPLDAVNAASTAAFLWIAAGPMTQKLERIKEKYGLR